MTDSGSQSDRPATPWREIGSLIAMVSAIITGPIGMIIGWILIFGSRRWDSREKVLADVLALPMGVLFFQPFSDGTGLAIGIVAAVAALAIVIVLARSALRVVSTEPPVAVSGTNRRPALNPLLIVAAWALTAVAGFTAWWAWMGWDGDDLYVAWQVIGSSLTVVLIVLAAWRFLPNPLTVSAVTIGYATGWGVSLMPGDDSGMSGVGLIMVAFGVFAASAVIVVLADAVQSARHRPQPN